MEWINNFYLPKGARSKALWYLIINAIMAMAMVGLSILINEIWAKIILVPMLIFYPIYFSILWVIILGKKLQDFFFYILLVQGIYLSASTISLFILLQSFPVEVFIICLITNICAWSYTPYFFHKKQIKFFMETLLQIDKSIYKEFDGYAWHSYYEGRLEFLWLPINNDTFTPYCEYGDLLCLREFSPIYNDDVLDITSLHNYGYVIKDIKGKYHYVKKNIYIDVRPEMDLLKSNIKNIYEITDKISDLKVYIDR